MPMEVQISKSERSYTALGLQVGIRADGRRCFDSRSVVVNAGILPQANGSAKVKLEGGGEDTVVLAAVKAEVGEPHADAPQNGWCEVNVDYSGSLFSRHDDPSRIVLGASLEKLLYRAIVESKALDTEALCIIPFKFCWVIYVDIFVVEMAGNVADATSMAAWLALNTAVVPKVKIVQGPSGKVTQSDSDSILSST
eukprot:342044_1